MGVGQVVGGVGAQVHATPDYFLEDGEAGSCNIANEKPIGEVSEHYLEMPVAWRRYLGPTGVRC
eukprot:90075-Prorocentrum_lima.AAC.1